MSHVTCHFTASPTPYKLETCNFHIIFTIPYVSSVTFQVSHVRCHMSGVTCHLSCVMCHVSQFLVFSKWLSWLVEALLSTGPTPSSFRLFLIKNLLIPKIYLFQLVVVRFWSLKKANRWEFNFREIGLDFKCQKWQTSAAAESAPCAHFQKLDVGINKKNSTLGLGIFPLVLWLLFMVKSKNKLFKNSKKM